MRFVNGEKSEGNFLQPIENIAAHQSLRRKIEQAHGALLRAAHHLALRRIIERAIQKRRRDSGLLQLRGLVLHQRDQRADHDAGFFHGDGRKLIAERFSSAGRHDDGDIAALQNIAHHGFLVRAKFRISPVLLQQLQQIGIHDRLSVARPAPAPISIPPATRFVHVA